MQNQWNDQAAQAMVAKYRERGVPEDLALRTYSARLIGSDQALVLHGGGNTSAKGKVKEALGAEIPVFYVKGSGWDLATIEPGDRALRIVNGGRGDREAILLSQARSCVA